MSVGADERVSQVYVVVVGDIRAVEGDVTRPVDASTPPTLPDGTHSLHHHPATTLYCAFVPSVLEGCRNSPRVY